MLNLNQFAALVVLKSSIQSIHQSRRISCHFLPRNLLVFHLADQIRQEVFPAGLVLESTGYCYEAHTDMLVAWTNQLPCNCVTDRASMLTPYFGGEWKQKPGSHGHERKA